VMTAAVALAVVAAGLTARAVVRFRSNARTSPVR
jgi:hypothetical protein